jgi:hypothetical protein
MRFAETSRNGGSRLALQPAVNGIAQRLLAADSKQLVATQQDR